MERILQGHALLADIENQWTDGAQETVWNGLRIKRRHAATGRELYRMAIDRFFGERLLARLEALGIPSPTGLRTALRPSRPEEGRWCDIGGLLALKSEIDRLEADVANGSLNSTEALDERLLALRESYEEWAWAWTWARLSEAYPEAADGNFVDTLCRPVIRKWAEATIGLNRQIIADARKEFEQPRPCVFGIDGDDAEAAADALAVKGNPETHPLIRDLEKQQSEIREKAELWLQKLGEAPSA